MTKKVVLYYRVSTKDQSIARQRPPVENFLKNHMHNYEVIKTITDKRSAWRYGLQDRPRLKQAVDLSLKQDATLVFASIDRLSRRSGIIGELLRLGVKIRFADYPDANNEMLIKFLEIIAESESNNTKVRIKQTIDAKFKIPRKKIDNKLKRIKSKEKKDAIKRKYPQWYKLGSDNKKIRNGWLKTGKQKSIKTRNEIANRKAIKLKDRIKRYRDLGYSIQKIVDIFNKDNVPTFSYLTKKKKDRRIKNNKPIWNKGSLFRVMERLHIPTHRKVIENKKIYELKDRIIRYRTLGYTIQEIVDFFNKEKIKPLSGGKVKGKEARWHRTTLTRVMKKLDISTNRVC